MSVAQLETTVIFFSAWDKSHVKWDNSRNSAKKMRITEKSQKNLSIYNLVSCPPNARRKIFSSCQFQFAWWFFILKKRIFQKRNKKKNVSLHLGGLWILVEVNWLLFVQNNWLQTHRDCSERSKRIGSSFSSLTFKIDFLSPQSQ